MPIIGKRKWTIKELRDKIGDFAIWSYYVGNFKPGRVITSPLRKDNDASFLIKYGEDEGHLKFSDLADSSIHGDFIDFIKLRHGYRENWEAAQHIASDFGLDTGIMKVNVQQWKERETEAIEEQKEYSDIRVLSRNFSLRELEYWNRHLQDISDLKREHIYAIKDAFINGQRVGRKKDELSFAYLFLEEQKWKLYFPERKEFKWFSNIPTSYVEGLDNIRNVDKGIITASRKCRLVLNKLNLHVCNTQNESSAGYTEDFVNYVEKNVKIPYIQMDTDSPGKKNSIALTGKLGWKWLNVPNNLYQEKGYKDFSDWIYREGSKEAVKYLKQKELL